MPGLTVGGLQSERREYFPKLSEDDHDPPDDLEVCVPTGPVRVAIVGTGGIARVHAAALVPGSGPGPGATDQAAAEHADAPAPATGVLVAAVDIDGERLAAFAREHGVLAVYHDLDELLRDARPDLV